MERRLPTRKRQLLRVKFGSNRGERDGPVKPQESDFLWSPRNVDGPALDVAKLAHSESVLLEKALPLRLCRRHQPSDPRGLSGVLLSEGAR
jgi:hypothetical protein